MSIQSFLGGIDFWAGRERFNLGTDDLDVGRVGGRKGGTFFPLAYAHMMRQESQPGGVLSDLHTQRQYGTQVRGILDSERGKRKEWREGLSRSGLNQATVSRMQGQDRYGTSRILSGLYGQLQGEQKQNEWGAMQGLANVMKEAELVDLQKSMWRKGLRQQQGMFNTGIMADLGGALIGAAGSIGGTAAGK